MVVGEAVVLSAIRVGAASVDGKLVLVVVIMLVVVIVVLLVCGSVEGVLEGTDETELSTTVHKQTISGRGQRNSSHIAVDGLSAAVNARTVQLAFDVGQSVQSSETPGCLQRIDMFHHGPADAVVHDHSTHDVVCTVFHAPLMKVTSTIFRQRLLLPMVLAPKNPVRSH